MALLLVAALLLSVSFARAAELPLSGIYGSRATCALFTLGGKDAVWRDGLDEAGKPLPVEADDGDEVFLLLEPTGLTTAGLRCSLSEVKGTTAIFGCDDHTAIELVVAIKSLDNIVVDDGFGESVLGRCQAP